MTAPANAAPQKRPSLADITNVGLSRTMYIRCTYCIFGWEITNIWRTYTVLANFKQMTFIIQRLLIFPIFCCLMTSCNKVFQLHFMFFVFVKHYFCRTPTSYNPSDQLYFPTSNLHVWSYGHAYSFCLCACVCACVYVCVFVCAYWHTCIEANKLH